MAWWIAYEVFSRAIRFVAHSRLVSLSWRTTAFQVRSTNFHSHTFLSFSRVASAQFADCKTCLTIQRILFQFEQIIAFSLVHTCLTLFKTNSFLCFSHLQSLHPSVLSCAQQSDHGPSPKRVSSIILVCKSN